MTELKTFDEVMQKVHSQGCNCRQEIRKEAIKWMKADKSHFYSRDGMKEAKLWIRDFFEIKEDELQ